MIGMENIIDHIAFSLNLDASLVRHNFYTSEKKIKDGMKPQTSHYGMEIKDFIVHEMMDEVLESSEYYTRRTKVAEWNKRIKY